MKKTELIKELNIDNEKEAIFDYLKNNWDGFENDEQLKNFINLTFDKSLELNKKIFDEYYFSKYRNTIFNNFLDKNIKVNNIDLKNYLTKTLLLIFDFKDEQEEMIINNSYEKKLNILKKEIQNFKLNVKPKGWKELAKNYCDFDGMEDLDIEKLKDEFKGLISSSPSSESFPIRLSLPHVMYSVKCQSETPVSCLLGAIFSHAYDFTKKQSNELLSNDWEELINELESGKTNIVTNFNHPINILINEIIINNSKNEKELIKEYFVDKKVTKKLNY